MLQVSLFLLSSNSIAVLIETGAILANCFLFSVLSISMVFRAAMILTFHLVNSQSIVGRRLHDHMARTRTIIFLPYAAM